jgi:hypothetical protein
MTNMIPRNDLIATQLHTGMSQESAITLPFPVIYLWAINGNPQVKAQGGAAYFGGFASKAEQVDPVLQDNNINLPTYLHTSTISLKDGTEYDGYTSRSLVLAPFAQRERWLNKDTGVFKLHYDKVAGTTRQHIQVLFYLADINDRKFEPWGPVVVTAQGYQAKFLTAAIKQWDKDTMKLRAEYAPGWPSNAFWCIIGTFGDKRESIMVGPTNSQSPITPLSLYSDPKLDGDRLVKLWVGQEVATSAIKLREQAEEWLGAWKNGLEHTVEVGASMSDTSNDEGPTPFPF